MDKLKKIFVVLSAVSGVLGFGASIWLYTVLKDTMSMVMIGLFFVALLWYGYNLYNQLKKN